MNAYIVDFARSPFQFARKGKFAGLRPDELAAQVVRALLACMMDLGLDPSKLNLNGGALALGHPLGATGARLTGKAASLLQRTGQRYALATQCIGGGQGIATVLERV